MRYHEEGDKIFMFGFSRGAFTARFLTRMISTVGLLSKGNEELVPFAYRTYQQYEMGKDSEDARKYMEKFQDAFCRASAKVHFLGLFDTVNSVGYFDTGLSKKKVLPKILETATHVRHAVAIDERRCKFKAALLSQDEIHESTKRKGEDIQEDFFPGNHGDVGGGWPPKDPPGETEADDPLQLSDLALEWMIAELDKLPKEHPTDQIVWNTNKDTFLKNFHRQNPSAAIKAPVHDLLRYGGGVSWLSTFLWRLMGMYCLVPLLFLLTRVTSEYLPFFSRLELKDGEWVSTVFPPNACGTRDIPAGATFHESVKQRMKAINEYRPTNDGGPKL